MKEEYLQPKSHKKGNIGGINVLNLREPIFKDPLEDVHTAALPIAGCAWIDTKDGVVLIDTLLYPKAAERVMERIKGKIQFIIYTHGHYDHVGGTKAFMKDNPEIIANKFLPDRLDRYEMLAPYRARIAAMQFNIPETDKPARKLVRPTKTFLGDMIFTLGGKTFELHTAIAETDDVCWVFIPELKAAFIGDLIIGNQFPNVGNPWKPTRFALSWAKELERVRALEPEHVFCNGAATHFKGNEAIAALDVNIEVIRSMHDQIVEYINQDMHISEMIHAVKIPDHLKKSPYLRTFYSRPEFFVYNVYRWYHGYFDHNPAHLLPRPEKEVMNEIFGLIWDSEKIINRVEELFSKGQSQLALEVLDVLIQSKPADIEARKLRIKLLKAIGENDTCLMSRNTWHYFINKDKETIHSLNKV
ncbi:MAG: MBL fold metallo-hydrolase [Candidatus Lokiarchaeota archaeon]|nr:MBL fold metallo-hydrolase [Candidatus Lokiarchaeota archaeon]